MNKIIICILILLTSPAFAGTTIIKKKVATGVTFSEDFSGTLSNWTPSSPAYASISSGTLIFTGEGFIRNNTDLGTGNIYLRFRVLSPGANYFVGMCGATGTCSGMNVRANATNFVLSNGTRYTTYTNWIADESNTGANTGEVYGATKYLGVTINRSNNVIKLWANVTAASPADVDTWDGGAADASQTFDTALPGNYAAFGVNTSPGADWDLDDLTGGSL